MNIKAKVRCGPVKSTDYSEDLQFHAVYSEDKTSENYTFSQATPCLTLTMSITNPGARGVFKEGEEYYLNFSPA